MCISERKSDRETTLQKEGSLADVTRNSSWLERALCRLRYPWTITPGRSVVGYPSSLAGPYTMVMDWVGFWQGVYAWPFPCLKEEDRLSWKKLWAPAEKNCEESIGCWNRLGNVKAGKRRTRKKKTPSRGGKGVKRAGRVTQHKRRLPSNANVSRRRVAAPSRTFDIFDE